MIINGGKFEFIFDHFTRASLFILDEPHECDGCHVAHFLFVARPGAGAFCLCCDNPRHEKATYDEWLLRQILQVGGIPTAAHFAEIENARSLAPEAR
jgi:hypothetical protein